MTSIREANQEWLETTRRSQEEGDRGRNKDIFHIDKGFFKKVLLKLLGFKSTI